MPIEQILELLKDKPDLIKEVTDIADRASAVEKVKLANAELTTGRATLEAEMKTLKAQIANAKGDGSSNAELNALKEDLAKLQADIKAANDKAESATREKRDTDLRNDIVTAAAPKAINAGQVFALMTAEKLVGYGEDGKAFFHRVNDKGEIVKAKNPGEAVDAFLKSNTHLEKSSGNGGSGGQPTKPGANGKFNPMDHL